MSLRFRLFRRQRSEPGMVRLQRGRTWRDVFTGRRVGPEAGRALAWVVRYLLRAGEGDCIEIRLGTVEEVSPEGRVSIVAASVECQRQGVRLVFKDMRANVREGLRRHPPIGCGHTGRS